MPTLFSHILDFLFPPTPESLKLRSLSPEEIFHLLPKSAPTPLPFVTSIFSYQDRLTKELVTGIKNKKDTHLLQTAGYVLYKKLSEIPGSHTLVPIPISKRRKNERGYNQCELLIDEILKLDKNSKFEKKLLLSRAKDRGEQKIKSREERLESTADIFNVTDEKILHPIIIIDDVCTTGSTLVEARKVLIQAGYPNIRALTLAH